MPMVDPIKRKGDVPMAPHLEVIAGGRIAYIEDDSVPPAVMVAKFDLTIAQYIKGVLTQLEALSRLLDIEGLSDSLASARQQSQDIVRRFEQAP